MKNFLFSLCAVAPLLIHSANGRLEFENEDFDPSDFIFLEIQQEGKENEGESSISLETVELLDIPGEQESKETLAEVRAPQISQGVQSKNAMCPDPTMCMPDIEPYQVNVRHTESKGIGYNQGYTTIEGVFTHSIYEYIPFLDVRGHVFDNGRLAANVGIGSRYLFNSSKTMVGINTFYDYRSLKKAHFNQWGVGLEGFYDRWEMRINGYLPFGKKKIVTDHQLNGIAFKNFQGNNLWINQNYTDKITYAMKGVDIEAAIHPFKIMRDYDCLIAAGPYYFEGEGKKAWGGKVRLKVEVAKYLFVELSDSYDKVFHNRFQGTISLSLPLGGKKCYPKKTANTAATDCFADNIMAWRGVQPVQRQEIIVAKKSNKSYTLNPVAINPATQQPISITFVNNQSSSSGNGTFENPYSTLANAEANTGPGSVIYVFAGDGTITNYDTGWILQEGQRFLGSAAAHNFNTTLGVVTVPIQTSLYPSITNAPGLNGVISTVTGGTLFNEISGFSLQQPSAAGGGSGVRIETQNLIMQNNFFIGTTFSSQNQATVFALISGKATITDNVFTGNASNSGLYIVKDATNGNADTVNLTISNNIFTDNAGDGMGLGAPPGATGILNLTFSGNVSSDNGGYGANIYYQNNPITTYATINSNTMYNNGLHGLYIQQLTTGTGFYKVYDNTLFNNDTPTGTEPLPGNVLFKAGTPGQNVCVNLFDNFSTYNTSVTTPPYGPGYNFSTSGGTISTEPFVNNIGSITGTYTPVPACSCGPCID